MATSKGRSIGRHAFPAWAFRACVATTLLLAVLIAGAGGAAADDPFPADGGARCLLRLETEYPEGADRREALGRVFDAFARYVAVTDQRFPEYRVAMAGYDVNYFLFAGRCDSAVAAAQRLVGAYRQSVGAPIAVRFRPETADPEAVIAARKFYDTAPRFHERDCIVAIDTIPTGPGETNESDLLSDFILRYGRDNPEAFGLVSFDWEDGRLFIQFWTACDRRVDKAQRMLDAYRQRYPGGPTYTVRADSKGPARSHATGGQWLDDYEAKH